MRSPLNGLQLCLRAALLLLALGLSLQAESRWHKAWRWSLAALVAGNAVDVWSSTGKYEVNPLLRDPTGRFSARRAVPIKAAGLVGLYLVQRAAVRRNPPAAKLATGINLGLTAGFAALSVHNFRVERSDRGQYQLP